MNLPSYNPGVGPYVVAFGGGVNSMAMLIGMRDRGIVPDAVTFSDTRGEKSPTYSYLQLVVRPWLRRHAFPDLLVLCRAEFPNTKTGDESLEAECLRLGTFPSRAYGFGTCADKWKIDPFKWWAKQWQPAKEAWALNRHVVRIIGYEAGEEHRVTDIHDKGFAKWFPLIEWGWDRDACKAAIVKEGLPLPPKSACFFCPSSTKEEILRLAREEPELMQRALAMEDRALATGRWSIKGLGRRFSWRELVEATEAEREQFEAIPAEECGVCIG